ncbi:hypothetical protein BsWGS_26674 [Bradybaena similaris]
MSDAEEGLREPEEKLTFFCDLSMQEFAFGVGALGVNGLCLGMMLNIPTLQLHKLMYKVAPKGLLQIDTTDQERFAVTKAIIDYWYDSNRKKSRERKFKMLYTAFKALRESAIAEELKARFLADQPISLEMFSTFDLGRLGPYIPVPVAVDAGNEEGWEEEEEEDYTQEDDD